MNSTETSLSAGLSERLAAEVFDRVIVPLALARRASAAPAYFPPEREANSDSYFSRPAVCVMQAADFEFPGRGTAEGLIEQIVEYWKRSGEVDLCVLEAMMKEVALALQEEADESDGTVSIFCYAMF